MADPHDHQLVARAVSSQDAAALTISTRCCSPADSSHTFGELVRRHQSHVRNFLRKLAGDATAADDLAQDCFMHAWDKLETFSGRGSFIGWLLKIAYTTFLQSKRKSKRYMEILEQVGHAARTEGRSFSLQPDEAGDVDKLLAVLTDEERAIFVMSYALGLSHREISEATEMPVGTVKSVIFRGKEKIRTSFDIKDHQYG